MIAITMVVQGIGCRSVRPPDLQSPHKSTPAPPNNTLALSGGSAATMAVTATTSAAGSATATSLEASPTDEAVEGDLRCVFPRHAPTSRSLRELGTSVVQIYGGESFCALDRNNHLWCGDMNQRNSLLRHPVDAPVSVSVTRGGYCALDASGHGACLVRLPPLSGGPSALNHTCALQLAGMQLVSIHSYDAAATMGLPFNYYLCVAHSDGRTSCYRRLFSYDNSMPLSRVVRKPTQIGGLTDVTALALPMSCALQSSGRVKCWSKPPEIDWAGPHYFAPPGLVARREAGRSWAPKVNVLRPLQQVVDLQSGLEHACALNRMGEVWCWGRDQVRQLGFKMRLPPPSYEDAPALVIYHPIQVKGLGPVTRLAVGAFHACAERSTGQVVCWGHNDRGQLGSTRNDCHAQAHAPGLTLRCAGPGVVPGITNPRGLAAQGRRTVLLTSTGAVSWIMP